MGRHRSSSPRRRSSSQRHSWTAFLGAVWRRPVPGLRGDVSVARLVVAAVACSLGAVVLRAGLRGMGVGAGASLLVWVAPLVAVVPLARRLPAALDGTLVRGAALAWALLAALALYQTARLGDFMSHAPAAARAPLLSHDWQHNCLTAYVEATRLALKGEANLYATSHYGMRFTEGVQVDTYLYPPPFLLLPRLALLVSPHILVLRALWFLLQAGLLALALVVTARWLGGRDGLIVGLCALPVWLAPPTLQTLQYGNFHVTALALAVLAMVAFAERRVILGGGLLGFAIAAKVFPGLLVVLLLVRRRFAAAAATALAVALYSGLTLAMTGAAPFVEFWRYAMPRLLDGSAFFFLDRLPVVAVSHSLTGAVLKLRALGVPVTGAWVATAGWVYTLLLAILVAWIGRRPRERLREAQLWVALLHLGALRSAFIPQEYALTTPLWLLALLAPEARGRRRWLLLGAAFLICATIVPAVHGGRMLPVWFLFVGVLVGQTVGVGLAVWAVVRTAPRAEATAAPTTAPAPALEAAVAAAPATEPPGTSVRAATAPRSSRRRHRRRG